MSIIDKIKSQVELPEYIESFVSLSSRGKSRWGICPFHNDNSPSLQVFRTKNNEWHWKCQAGCGGGDIIDFYKQYNSCSAREAISSLATEFGIESSRSLSGGVSRDYLRRLRKVRKVVDDKMWFQHLVYSFEETHEALIPTYGDNFIELSSGKLINWKTFDPIDFYLFALSMHPTKRNREIALREMERLVAEVESLAKKHNEKENHEKGTL